MSQTSPSSLSDSPSKSDVNQGVAVSAHDLGKRFKIYSRPSNRLIEWATLGRVRRHDEFWALRSVSFEVGRGEVFAIVGVNGSGKSTLLKIISGAAHPTEGCCQAKGRVLSLLELGTGFNPELTGRMNVHHTSRLLGFADDEAAVALPQVEEFAELGKFFDRPLKTYSTGMAVRLAFSVFACFHPDVFIVDEAISVGDVFFQAKCVTRIEQLVARGTTVLLVSHDLAAVAALCDRAMVLDAGRVQFLGEARQAIRHYQSLVGARMGQSPDAALSRKRQADFQSATRAHDAATSGTWEDLPWQTPGLSERIGEGSVKITGICYRIDGCRSTQVVEQGQWIEIFARYEAAVETGPLNGALQIYDRLGQLHFAVNWMNAELEPLWLGAEEIAVCRFRIRADLEPGEYATSLGISEALPDPAGPRGWSQHIGGRRFDVLPQAGRIAVFPRGDRRRCSFGPARLKYVVECCTRFRGSTAAG